MLRSTVWTALIGIGLSVFAFGCKTAVVHQVPEDEANRIIAILQEQGIMATKQVDDPEKGTWRIVVPRRDAVKVWGILQEYRLPSPPRRRFRDIFGKSKLVVTPLEERALFLEALQGELEHTLESVTGVVMAQVHIVLPEEDITGEKRGEAKASVVIEYRPDPSGQAPLRETDVQQIVANAVEGLVPDRVSVVMKPIRIAPVQPAYDFVAFGPVVIARASLTTMKWVVTIILVAFIALGLFLLWQGRLMGELRDELVAAQRQLRAMQRSAKSSGASTGS